jgi:hypothetical protein
MTPSEQKAYDSLFDMIDKASADATFKEAEAPAAEE